MKNLTIIFISLCTFLGCTLKNQNRLIYNNDIDLSIQNEIELKTSKLLENIHENNCFGFVENSSESFQLSLGDNYCADVEWIHEITKNGNLKLLKTIYTKKSPDLSVLKFSSQLESYENFDFAFNQAKRESHISFYEADLGVKSYLITLIYSKIEGEWQLDVFNFGEFSLYKQTAIYYYKKSKKLFKNGLLIEALIQFELCQKLLKPSGNHLQYKIQDEIDEFRIMLKSKLEKVEFPLAISEVSTSPKIYSLFLTSTDEGYLPTFLYTTSIDLEDSVLLKAENELLHNVLKKNYPSIFNVRYKQVLYRTSNEILEENTHRKSFGFVIDLNPESE
jgi:hypothetical protein